MARFASTQISRRCATGRQSIAKACNSKIPSGCPCGCSNGLARFARSACVPCLARLFVQNRNDNTERRREDGTHDTEEDLVEQQFLARFPFSVNATELVQERGTC